MSILKNPVTWLALVVALLAAQSAWAQAYGGMNMQMPMQYPARGNSRAMNPNARPPAAAQTPFQGTGVIEGTGAAGLKVNANGMTWLVKPDPRNCKIELTGTADPEFLKPGLLVRFTGDFDKKTGKATAPLNELEIVSKQTAMVGEKGRGGLATADKGEKKQKGAPVNAMNSGTFVGTISGVKNNELTIETGSGMLKAELGTNPSIKVNVSEYGYAQIGDKVDVTGWYMQPGAAFAREIKITLTNPLGSDGVKKKPAAKIGDKTATTAK